MKQMVMGKNTSVSLGNHFESFIESSLSTGRFQNASEIVRAGLRLLEEEENRVVILKNSIQEGLDSGLVKDFDPKKHLETIRTRRNKNV